MNRMKWPASFAMKTPQVLPTLDRTTYNFQDLLVRYAILLKSTFLRMRALVNLHFHIGWIVGFDSDNDCFIKLRFLWYPHSKLPICTMCCNPLRLFSIITKVRIDMVEVFRYVFILVTRQQNHSIISQLKISYYSLIIKW